MLPRYQTKTRYVCMPFVRLSSTVDDGSNVVSALSDSKCLLYTRISISHARPFTMLTTLFHA